jgi:hypothetical protein
METMMVKKAVGIAELAGFLLLTVFIYKISEAISKHNRKPAVVVIRTISIFLLVDGITNAF